MSGSRLRFVVITGMSGAGRRTAAHALEDLGWYVVDNLPPSMLPGLVDAAAAGGFPRVAVVLDVRTRAQFDEIPAAFDALNAQGVWPQIVYVEAADEVIVRRQESVRRPHPLQGAGPLLDGVRRERAMLAMLRAAADMVLDTSDLNVHQLTSRVAFAFNSADDREFRLTLMSFGFKNGLPVDADMVLDVRFLPNPHWVPELRPQTGLSQAVSGYVLGHDAAQTWLASVRGLVSSVIPGYLTEGKRLATLAVGCTGGKHRSTSMAEELARRLRSDGVVVLVVHRDLGLE
ncbi:RNase adapter RapZ [Propioniciclava soli]|uniref:RNase adapter RapZ n=1 Tax=Propioniciclava soli TaxID=2775081 RepID=UPI001E445639|nr:RNase adapter RapZ [Propioniciclava soli]